MAKEYFQIDTRTAKEVSTTSVLVGTATDVTALMAVVGVAGRAEAHGTAKMKRMAEESENFIISLVKDCFCE